MAVGRVGTGWTMVFARSTFGMIRHLAIECVAETSLADVSNSADYRHAV